MQMLNCKAELCNVKFGLVLRESDLSRKMETEISSRAIVQSKIKIVWGLESEMQVNNKLVISLL